MITACAVAALIYDPPPDPCATAREVGRAAVAAGTRVPTRVNLLGASAAAGNPLHAPQELVEANDLHRRGDHVADLPLFRKAAEAGSEEAMTSLGLAYLNGEGTPVQRDSGVKWLREAAGNGDPRGMSELGSAYLKGYAGGRDLDYWARHWFYKAAAEDYPEAMANLGNIYREGLGVDRDSTLALDWYQRAARRGVVDAMVEIGWMYDEGLAVAPNEKQAVCWYRAASKAGSARGRQALERLRN